MAGSDPPNEQAVVAAFEQLINERDHLSAKTVELQSELAEHDLVLKTLEPLDSQRKCFRLVGDVLVERTVGEVVPAVKKNRDNLATVQYCDWQQVLFLDLCGSWLYTVHTCLTMQTVDALRKQLDTKQKEVLVFQERYKIRFKVSGSSSRST